MDSIDLGKALFGKQADTVKVNTSSNYTSPTNTTTISGVALANSDNGMVTCLVAGTTCDVPTTVSVKDGDTVIISNTAHNPVVTGVIAGGDRAQAEVDNAAARAEAAHAAAEEATTAAGLAATAASEATTAAQAATNGLIEANQQIADTRADVEAVQADIASQKEELDTVSNTMDATLASIGDLSSLDTTLVSKVEQSAAQISSTVSEVTQLQTDMSDAQEDIAAATNTAAAAQSKANEAVTAAATAQTKANEATQAAADAQTAAITAAEAYADDIAETLQGQIDGTIETWTGNGEPTSENEPERSWSGDPSAPNSKQKHIGDLYYDTQSGYAYRYDAMCVWVLIKDTDVTKAIGDAAQAIADAASAADAAAGAADVATAAQSAADDAKQAADEAQQAALALASRMTAAETSISQNSTDISLRATKKELEALTVGASNLVKGTADWTIPNASGTGYTINADILRTDLASMSYSWRQDIENAVCYTFCVEAISIGPMATVTVKGFNYRGVQHFSNTVSVSNNEWVRVSATFYGRKDTYGNYLGFDYQSVDIMPGDAHGIQFRHVQLVKGNKASDWTPAYEDLMAYTDAQVKVNANAIKAEVTKRTQTDSKVSTLTETADGLRIDLTATQGDVETLNSYLEYAGGTLTLGKKDKPSKVCIDNVSMDVVVGDSTVATFGEETIIGAADGSHVTIANGIVGIMDGEQGFGFQVNDDKLIINKRYELPDGVTVPFMHVPIVFTEKITAVGLELEEQLDISQGGTGAKSVKEAQSTIGLAAYPVGAIYISTVSTSPASLFGGSWTQIQNQFLLAAGSSYGAGTTGGAASHQHWQTNGKAGGEGMYVTDCGGEIGSRVITGSYGHFNYSGGGWGAMRQDTTYSASSMPPYLAVYMWKRTA